MRAALLWLAVASAAAAPLDRHPWTEATEAEDGCFVVETNTFPEVGRDVAEQLRRAQAFYEDRFGPVSDARPMRIALFRTREEYLKFGEGVSGAVGHFDAALDRCALMWDGTLGETGWPVAVHEACHHYVRRSHPDARTPSWYGEGIACYFEGLLDPLAEHGVARLRVKGAKVALENGEARLDALLLARAEVRTGRLVLDSGDSDVPGLPPARFYGLAWSLVHFLATDALYEERFRRFELRLLAARAPAGAEEALARTLLLEECGDLSAIEERWHAHVRGLEEPKVPVAAPAYAWELASGNPYVRYGALRRAAAGPLSPDLRAGALACLRDRDLLVRSAACRAFAGSMGEDTVAPMIEALDLGDPEMKDAAMRALAFEGAEAAVPRLIAEKDDKVGALRALATIGDPRSNHLLAAALDDPLLPAGLRARCAETLAKFKETTPRVEAALEDRSPAVRTGARAGLEHAGQRPAAALSPRRLEKLLSVLANANAERRDACDACRELGSARANEAVPALKQLCRPHVDDVLRLEAVRALVAITGETRGFEAGQSASAREAAYRAWAE